MINFSIIIATYNAENKILKTLSSLADCKSKDNFEIIIVDGGSKDATLDEVCKFKELFPIKIVSEPDKGIYDAWNKGINLALGEWLIFLGAGDLINEEWLLCINNFSKQNFNKLDNVVLAGYPLFQTPLLKRKLVMNVRSASLSQVMSFEKSLTLPYLHSGSANHKSLFERRKFNSDFKILGDLEFINYVKPAIYFLDCIQCYYSFGGISSSAVTAKQQMEERMRIAELYSIPVNYISKIRLFVRNKFSKFPFFYDLIWEIYLNLKYQIK